MKTALGTVADNVNIKPEQKDDYVQTMFRRLSNMFSRIHDGERRTPNSPWVLSLPWVRRAGLAPAADAPVPLAAAPEVMLFR